MTIFFLKKNKKKSVRNRYIIRYPHFLKFNQATYGNK